MSMGPHQPHIYSVRALLDPRATGKVTGANEPDALIREAWI